MVTKKPRRRITRQRIDMRLMDLLTEICSCKRDVEVRYRQMRIQPDYREGPRA